MKGLDLSAIPTAEAASGDVEGAVGEEGSSGEDLEESTARITYGDPGANQLLVRRRGRRYLELELVTEGFYAIPQDDGEHANTFREGRFDSPVIKSCE